MASEGEQVCVNCDLTDYSPNRGLTFCDLSKTAFGGLLEQDRLEGLGLVGADDCDDVAGMRLGMDANVIALRSVYEHPVTGARLGGMFLLQSVRALFPMVDDAYTMGFIACSSSLNGIYAAGVSRVDNVLMILCLSTQLNAEQRNRMVPQLMKGFMDCAVNHADTCVEGGQSVMNPSMMIGGIASTVCRNRKEFIGVHNLTIEAGDYVVVTKPIGALVGLIAQHWLKTNDPRLLPALEKLKKAEKFIRRGYDLSVSTMCQLNRSAAACLRKYNVHLATEITNGGIIKAAQTLLERLKSAKIELADHINIIIHRIPVIEGLVHVARLCSGVETLEQRIMTSVFSGTTPEISGGLLLIIPQKTAIEFCKEMTLNENQSAYIIGKVEEFSPVPPPATDTTATADHQAKECLDYQLQSETRASDNFGRAPDNSSTNLTTSATMMTTNQQVQLIDKPWLVDGNSPVLYQEI